MLHENMKLLTSITDKDINGSEYLSDAKPRIAVGAVLFDRDNNIAINRLGAWEGLYMLPGGGVEDGEDFITALKREILEETGCECKIFDEIGQTYENRGSYEFTQKKYYYLAKVIGERSEMNLTESEIEAETELHWLPPEKAFRLVSERQFTQDRFEFIKMRDTAVLLEVLKTGSNYFIVHEK